MSNLGIGSYSAPPIPDFVTVGNYSSIGDNVFFHDGHDNHLCIKNRKCVFTTNWGQPTEEGGTHIGNDVWIGREAKIMFGVNIGDGAIVGAYTVVAKDVPPFAVVVGNPMQIKRFRFTPEQIAELLRIKWWDRNDMNENTKEMHDIDEFLRVYK